ncbi:MAG TPA: hypothetical protein VN442_09740 [Bryobacteraceae bacterium]|nr:hypothetical protein [Bryobacteraceae bacterium]
MKAQANDSQKKNLELLTDPQKTRLKVLEEALNLIPTVREAQNGNVLGPIAAAPAGFVIAMGIYGFSSSGSSGVYGCTPSASAWFDTSEFQSNRISAPSTAR